MRHTGQHAEGGGLAGSIDSEQAKQLTLADTKGKRLHSLELRVVGCAKCLQAKCFKSIFDQ